MTPYVDRYSGKLVTDHRLIALRYLAFWFWPDVITLVPFDLIAYFTPGTNLEGLRILRLLRLVRLLRLFRAARIMERLETHFFIPTSRSLLVRMVVLLLFMCHWIACLMGLLPVLEGAEYVSYSAEQIFNLTDNGTVALDVPFNWQTGYFVGSLGWQYGEYSVWSVYLAG